MSERVTERQTETGADRQKETKRDRQTETGAEGDTGWSGAVCWFDPKPV